MHGGYRTSVVLVAMYDGCWLYSAYQVADLRVSLSMVDVIILVLDAGEWGARVRKIRSVQFAGILYRRYHHVLLGVICTVFF